MIDEKSGVEEQADAPAEDIPESESPKEAEDQQQPEEQSPESETGKNEESEEIPKDNAAWAAMRTENKRLKEVVDAVDPEYLDKLQSATLPQDYPQQEVREVPEDAEYGQVTQGLNYAQQQAVQANQRINQLQVQLERQQDAQAMDAYPEMKTDKVFQQIVAEKKLASRVLGNDRTTLEIAKEVRGLLDRKEKQTEVATEEKVKQQQLEKQAAMAEGRGNTTGGSPKDNDEALRMRVRKGDSDAQTEVAKRLIADLEIT